MKAVAIVTRRLKEGKTYGDFRRAWYHTVGFGTSSKFYTSISVSDPREITVTAFIDIADADPHQLESKLKIEVKERLDHPLEEVIEPEIARKFGILISEDDFSVDGQTDYKPPTVDGKEIDLNEFFRGLSEFGKAIANASHQRDEARKAKGLKV